MSLTKEALAEADKASDNIEGHLGRGHGAADLIYRETGYLTREYSSNIIAAALSEGDTEKALETVEYVIEQGGLSPAAEEKMRFVAESIRNGSLG